MRRFVLSGMARARRFAVAAFALFLAVSSARAADGVNLLAFGDWGCGSTEQVQVARAMADYVKAAPQTAFDATLALGDNFYTLVTDAQSPFWETWFEKMYDKEVLAMPFYAILGNHDVEHSNITANAELAYAAAHPESRWKMPSRYYRLDFPKEKPLATVLMLDGTLQGRKWDEEAAWLDGELAKERPRWLIVASHFPLYSNSEHGDSKTMLKRLDKLLDAHRVDFYLAGHDHNLQHLQIDGHTTSHIVSGGGGKKRYAMYRDDRGPFAASTYGFLHLALTPERATARFVSHEGKTLHLFERTPDGRVDVKESTGIGKAVPRPAKKPDKKK